MRLTLASNRKYYLFDGFTGSGLVFGFSTRLSGNTSLFYGDTHDALENRKQLLKELDIDHRSLVCAKQAHTNRVSYIQENDAGRGALSSADAVNDTDSFITDKINVPLSIFTADCLSIFLYDSKRHAIGLAHAGWRSSKSNIAAKTVQLMSQEFDSKAEDLYIGFGPAIRECCYEVGKEVVDSFGDAYLRERLGRYYLDLAGINKKELLAQGVQEKNIFDTGICTSCRSREFFSYRKEGSACGRLVSIAMLRQPQPK